jgi:hypothetical protein
VSAFAISSFLAGISGALYASYLSFVTPDQWSLLLSIQYVAAIIVGGIGTVWGPVLGSIVIFALPAVLQSLVPHTTSGGLLIDEITSIVYGVLIIAFFVFEPGGVVGLAGRVLRVRRRAGESGEPMQKRWQQRKHNRCDQVRSRRRRQGQDDLARCPEPAVGTSCADRQAADCRPGGLLQVGKRQRRNRWLEGEPDRARQQVRPAD